ncbi:MAG TPA: hypothetical protein VJG32_00490 [Anaerolineae bacterium]|nr:hypothetical protein [Anaerolineae bacterium]
MDAIKVSNRRYESIAWGALFIWIGAVWLIPGDAFGVGWLGIGVILLGLNLARRLRSIPTNWFSITLGVIALILGAAKLLLSTQGTQVELPLFPVLFIVIGVIVLVSVIVNREATVQP